jgi:hypothetical protein
LIDLAAEMRAEGCYLTPEELPQPAEPEHVATQTGFLSDEARGSPVKLCRTSNEVHEAAPELCATEPIP